MVQAFHIIGGEITYECLGEGSTPESRQFQFTMRIYRDCQALMGADFDSAPNGAFPATVSIYDGTRFFETLILGPPKVTVIEPNQNPCFQIADNVCVEEGVYVMPIVELPFSLDSYHIVYQRCCRNTTISNISNPGQRGATYTTEITPNALRSCNNSPVFNDFPPVVICVQEDLAFDHAASDTESDQLVYSFCAPLLGGGANGGQINAPNGVAPDPDLPPPYVQVPFIAPLYTPQRPLGNNADLRIDENTGVITGRPDRLGQFVVGVCVEEYRNGELLSVLRRDFQFNVINCTPTVRALIEADSIIGDQHFLINSCGDSTLTLRNRSIQRSNIFETNWAFSLPQDTLRVNSFDARVTFPGIGQYDGTLILNPSTDCGDTAQVTINIFPPLTADFSYDYDTCVAGPTTFTDLSVAESGDITSWEWQFGDGENSIEQNPIHTYRIPGELPVTLKVEDINNCTNQVTQPISYFPAPALIVVEPSSFVGCIPGAITFNNLSFPIDSTYDIQWDFGNGDFSSEISPDYAYLEPGTYTVRLDITSPIGCTISKVFPELITAVPAPIADFIFAPQSITSLNPEVQFFENAIDAEYFLWNFSAHGESTQPNPFFSFPDTGRQEIRLLVTHQNGCQDSILKVLDVIPIVSYFLPNAFTPNNDGRNDLFMGTGQLEGMRDFNFNIWNRWGELIFHSDDPRVGWNGNDSQNSSRAPQGVYVYTFKYRTPRGQLIEEKGTLSLIR